MSRFEYDYFVFEWDENKNISNLHKHGIAFEDVIPIFFENTTLTKQHKVVDGEMRWKTLGKINNAIILFVGHLSYDEDEDRELIRIITARQATKAEEKEYYDNY